MLQIRTKDIFGNNLHWPYRTGYLLEARNKSRVGSRREGKKPGRQKHSYTGNTGIEISQGVGRKEKGVGDQGRILKEMPGIGGNLVLNGKCVQRVNVAVSARFRARLGGGRVPRDGSP